MRTDLLRSRRTAFIVVGLVVLALVPIVLVAVLGLDDPANDTTPAASTPDTQQRERADALAALGRRVEVLERRDERRSESLAQLRDDLDEADATLAALDGADLPEALAATDEQLAGLVDGLTVLDEDLAVLQDDVAAQRTELESTTAELRGGVDEVRSELTRVGGNVEVLRGEIATLRDRLDRIQRGG